MNKNSIPLFIGVITSLVVILLINKFTVVDDCLDNGGSFDYQTGQCLLVNGDIHVASFTHYLIAFYFIMAISIAFVVSKLVKRLFNVKKINK
jgi:hypothetical protein